MPLDAAPLIAVAQIAGTHALAVFCAALAVLLLVVGSTWLIVHRLYVQNRGASDSAAARVRAATLVFAFAAIAIAALMLVMLPTGFVADHPLALADQAMTDAVRRSTSASTLRVFAAITVLANTPVQWAIAIVGALILLAKRDRALAIFWVAAIAGNGILNRLLKATFERARPLFEHDLFAVQGWSFPSGHASGAVAVYGALAYVLIRSTSTGWHLPVVLAAAAVAFATGCSRIFLQVHYASDVLAGFASGLAWLSICVVSAELIARPARRINGRDVRGMPAERR